MKSSDCFAYHTHPEWVVMTDGRAVKTFRDECGILRHMQCRRKPDAKAACNFFKTKEEFEAGIKKYGGLKPEPPKGGR